MSTNENIYENFFDFSIVLLKYFALWIYDENTKAFRRHSQLFYNIFFSIFMYIIYFSTESFYLTLIYKDLTGTAQSLRDIGNHLAAIIKALNWFIMRKRILKLIQTLQDDTFNYDEHGDYKPKEIVARFKKSTVNWTTSFIISINVICSSMLLTGFYLFFFKSEEQFKIINGKRIYMQELPVNVVTPFGTETRSTFFVTFLYVVFSCTFYGGIIGGIQFHFKQLYVISF